MKKRQKHVGRKKSKFYSKTIAGVLSLSKKHRKKFHSNNAEVLCLVLVKRPFDLHEKIENRIGVHRMGVIWGPAARESTSPHLRIKSKKKVKLTRGLA